MHNDSERSRERRSLALRVLAILAIVIGLGFMMRGIDVGSIGRTLSRARWWPIAIATVINFGIILSKAIAWRLLLAPDHRVSVARIYRYTLISYAASVILPLRAGELVRLWMLRDHDGVPVARGASVAIAEKLLDVISMLLLVAPVPLIVADLPRSVTLWISGLAVGALVLVWALRRLGPRLGSSGWRGELGRGLAVLHAPRRAAVTVAILLVGWLIDLAMIDLVLWAIGIDVPAGAGVLLLFAINVAVAVPSTPGGVGALELGAVLALHMLHVPEAESLAFALLYHALQVVPITLAGVLVGAPELFRRHPKVVAKDPSSSGH